MTDLEINIALAKAIGWEKDQTIEVNDHLYVADWIKKETRASILQSIPVNQLPWRLFDYRDPVIFVAICKHWELDVNHHYKWVSDRSGIMRDATNCGVEKAAALCVIDTVKMGIK